MNYIFIHIYIYTLKSPLIHQTPLDFRTKWGASKRDMALCTIAILVGGLEHFFHIGKNHPN